MVAEDVAGNGLNVTALPSSQHDLLLFQYHSDMLKAMDISLPNVGLLGVVTAIEAIGFQSQNRVDDVLCMNCGRLLDVNTAVVMI